MRDIRIRRQPEILIFIYKPRRLLYTTVFCNNIKCKAELNNFYRYGLSSKMEKLPICRICLAENVRMYIVVNRNLQELYERLTDIPFITEDRRPMLACFFCCAKLKQCYRLLRKCLEAEELFAQMNEDYEPNPLINQDHLEFFGGFIKCPTVHISIVDECQTEDIAIKELPAVCEELDDIIEPKEEHQSEEQESENIDNSCPDVADIPPHCSEADLEDDVPLMEFKTDVGEEQEVSKKKRRAREVKKQESENIDNSCPDVADISPHCSEADLEDDVPLTEFNTAVGEEQEVSNKKRRAREVKRAAVARKPIPPDLTKKDKSDLKVVPKTQKRPSKPGTYFKEPYKGDQRRFNPLKKMIQHTRTQNSRKPFKCDVCQRSFSAKGNLLNHIRKHTGEKPFMCNVCQRTFSEKGNLAQHFRIHTGEKPYECDVCQRSFSGKEYLKKHIRVHTGVRVQPYKCDVCQRSFREISHLTEHIRIHTGEKPYKCDICQRSFSRKSNFSRHIRIHTGEKPYKCDICQRCYSQKDYLSTHIRKHTGEKRYKCDVGMSR